MTDIFSKELSIGQILSEGFLQIKKNLKKFLILSIIFYLPLEIIFLSILFFAGQPDQLSLGLALSAIVILVVRGILLSIASFFIFTTIYFLVDSSVNNKPIDIKTALLKAKSRFWSVVGVGMLIVFYLALLSLLFVIPAIIFAVFWCFALYAAALRNKGGGEALSYSRSLVKNRWWKVFGLTVVYIILIGASSVLISFVADLPSLFLPNSPISEILFEWGTNTITAIFTVIPLVFFINLDAQNKPPLTEQEKRLKDYIKRMRANKYPDNQIRANLKKYKYSDEELNKLMK